MTMLNVSDPEAVRKFRKEKQQDANVGGPQK